MVLVLCGSTFVTLSSFFLLRQVVDRCKEEGKRDGNYNYFAADMSNMTSAEALIQVMSAKNRDSCGTCSADIFSSPNNRQIQNRTIVMCSVTIGSAS